MAEPILKCRRLVRGRLEAHVTVGDINLRVSGREQHVIDLLKEVERVTGERLPLPSWMTPHFVKPMAGQTSLLSEEGNVSCKTEAIPGTQSLSR